MFTVAPLQSSVAVGGVNDGVAVQSIVVFAGTVPMVGALVSVDRKSVVKGESGVLGGRGIIKKNKYTLVQVLPVVVLPTMFTVAPLQSSVAVGGVNDGVAVQSIVVFAGTVPMVGALVSVTARLYVTLA